VNGYNEIFNLAADMGGMGFIENNKAACMISVLINTHLLLAARDCGIDRSFMPHLPAFTMAKNKPIPITPIKRIGCLSGP